MFIYYRYAKLRALKEIGFHPPLRLIVRRMSPEIKVSISQVNLLDLFHQTHSDAICIVHLLTGIKVR